MKNFFWKKSLTMPKKTERGDPLVSPGMVCYAGKTGKPFWFSSLGQMVQFGAIIFCRTFVELFWSVQVVFKKTHPLKNGIHLKNSKELGSLLYFINLHNFF